MSKEVALYVGEALGKYGFPNGHPFGPDRQDAFWKETVKQGLDKRARLTAPVVNAAPRTLVDVKSSVFGCPPVRPAFPNSTASKASGLRFMLV